MFVVKIGRSSPEGYDKGPFRTAAASVGQRRFLGQC